MLASRSLGFDPLDPALLTHILTRHNCISSFAHITSSGRLRLELRGFVCDGLVSSKELAILHVFFRPLRFLGRCRPHLAVSLHRRRLWRARQEVLQVFIVDQGEADKGSLGVDGARLG